MAEQQAQRGRGFVVAAEWLSLPPPALTFLKLNGHSSLPYVPPLQFATKLVSTVETMDASGSSSFEAGGWAAEGGGGDDWQ